MNPIISLDRTTGLCIDERVGFRIIEDVRRPAVIVLAFTEVDRTGVKPS